MDPDTARQRFAAARVARLATVRVDGRPHLVPVTFAVDGDEILTAVDAKPKSTRRLRRLDNIEANPAVALLADEYAEDWSRLLWVRADGEAAVHRDEAERQRAGALLAARYQQYRDMPPQGPVIVVAVTRWRGWSAT